MRIQSALHALPCSSVALQVLIWPFSTFSCSLSSKCLCAWEALHASKADLNFEALVYRNCPSKRQRAQTLQVCSCRGERGCGSFWCAKMCRDISVKRRQANHSCFFRWFCFWTAWPLVARCMSWPNGGFWASGRKISWPHFLLTRRTS